MLETVGNLFQINCDAICITTNGIVKSDGSAVMGKGIALTAKQKYPGIDYILGSYLQVRGNHVHLLNSFTPAIISFPTKNQWRDKSDLNLIHQSCLELIALTNESLWKKVLLPRPGCGLGGLRWVEVKPILTSVFNDRFVVVSLK